MMGQGRRLIVRGELRRTIRVLKPPDDGVKIGAHGSGIQAAQPVIGAELNDRVRRPIAKRPVEPRKPTGAGIARNTTIENARRETLRDEFALQLVGKSVVGSQPVTGRQTIAQHQYAKRFRSERHAGKGKNNTQ